MTSPRRERAGIVALVVMCFVAVGVAGWLAFGSHDGSPRVVAPAAASVDDRSSPPESAGADAVDVDTRIGARTLTRNGQLGIEYGIEITNPSPDPVTQVRVTFKLDLEDGKETRDHRIVHLDAGETTAVSGFVPLDDESAVKTTSAIGVGIKSEEPGIEPQIIFEDVEIVEEDGLVRLVGLIESHQAEDLTGGVAEVVFVDSGRIAGGQRVVLPYIPAISRIAFEVPLHGDIPSSWDPVVYLIP